MTPLDAGRIGLYLYIYFAVSLILIGAGFWAMYSPKLWVRLLTSLLLMNGVCSFFVLIFWHTLISTH